MTREELIKSPEYWTTKLQMELFREIEDFMQQNNMNRTQLADYLGCTRGYVTQLLNGDFDNKLSKLVSLSLAIGKVPSLEFTDVNDIINPKKITLRVCGGFTGRYMSAENQYTETAA
jgi:predicted XRE-type DNA-binding protein